MLRLKKNKKTTRFIGIYLKGIYTFTERSEKVLLLSWEEILEEILVSIVHPFSRRVNTLQFWYESRVSGSERFNS